ncbi:MAG: hypothetical protein ABW006_09810 [Hyphomicrobium sp.]
MTTTPNDTPDQKALALELLGGARRIFQKPRPTRDELLDAGRAIARAVRNADDLGFRSEIQQALAETRSAAELAARLNKFDRDFGPKHGKL